jgi:hypothetical protein
MTDDAFFARTFYISFPKITLRKHMHPPPPPGASYDVYNYQ